MNLLSFYALFPPNPLYSNCSTYSPEQCLNSSICLLNVNQMYSDDFNSTACLAAYARCPFYSTPRKCDNDSLCAFDYINRVREFNNSCLPRYLYGMDFTDSPTMKPSAVPSVKPSVVPTTEPTMKPSAGPSAEPSAEPSVKPSAEPSAEPTVNLTNTPTTNPTGVPTTSFMTPTNSPTGSPDNSSLSIILIILACVIALVLFIPWVIYLYSLSKKGQ